MKRAYIIIATGRPVFGEMALNLCLSLKANEPQSQVMLLHDSTSIKGNEERIGKYFDIAKCSSVFGPENPATLAHLLKLQAFQIAKVEGITEAIILDADTMILPDKRPSQWFEQYPRDFVAYTNDCYYYQTKKYEREGENFWCDPEKAKDYFSEPTMSTPFPAWNKMPQINASFIYFKVSRDAELVFEEALKVWNDSGFTDYKNFRGGKSEEMCFNIAMAKTGTPLPIIPYRPLYLQCYSENRAEHYIQHRFRAFSLATDTNHDSRIVTLYNRLSDYYRDHFGIRPRFHFEQDMKLIKDPRKIYGYWHIAMMGNWKKVIKEQLSLMEKNGLYQATEMIYVGAVGNHSDFEKLNRFLFKYTKFQPHFGGALTSYEFPTLELLRKNADIIKSHFGWYIHTKGVSDPRGAHWRDFLNHFNIVKWRDCQNKIRNGADLCGVKLIQAGTHPMHYSGNFFHFDSEYVKKLKPVESLNQTNRFEAEMWVCSEHPSAATLSQKMIDHYNHEQFKESYTAQMKEWAKKVFDLAVGYKSKFLKEYVNQ